MSQFVTRPRPMLTGQRLVYDWGFGHGPGVIPLGVMVLDTDLNALFMGDDSTVGGLLYASRTKQILSGELVTPTLSSATHDYNPAGVEKAATLVMSCPSNVTWTGLRAVEGANTDNEPGRQMSLVNLGPGTFVMPGESTSSTDKYRWGFNGLLLFEPGQGMTMRVVGSGSNARWKITGGPAAFTFSRIAAGGASILAEQPGDTLTFTDRHGIGMVGIDGTDTIEISSAAPIVSRYVSGTYHTSPFASVGVADVLCTTDLLYAHPFWPARQVAWTRMGVNVATAAAGKIVRLGVYEEALDGTGKPIGQPGLLAFDAGSISVASTGWQEITINQVLRPRLYWLVLVSDGAPTLKGLQVGGNPGFGWLSDFTRVNHLTRAAAGVAAGGLPANESAQAYNTLSANHPAAFLRVV